MCAVDFVDYFEEVLAVAVLEHGLGELGHLLFAYPSLAVGDAFEAGYLEALALLKHFDVDAGFGEGVVGAGVEPCKTARQDLHLEFAVVEEFLIDSGDLEFASGGGLDSCGYVNYLVGVEVEAYYGIVGLGVLGFFLDGEAVALLVEFCYAVAFGVIDPVAEHGGFAILFGGFDAAAEDLRETGAMEDVVAEHEAGGVVADEVAADDEGLGEAVGRGLFGIAEVDAVVAAVAEEALEAGQVVGRGDDEDVADAGEHQGRDGIIYHRLVVDGEELLAHALGDGIETGAGSAG